MCQNVPPLELFDDDFFNMLRPTWQNAVSRLCVRLHKHGDGTIPDEWLHKKILPWKRWLEFKALMLTWKWLREDPETGNLCRAGILAPGPADAEEPGTGPYGQTGQPAAVRDADRMYLSRKFDELREELINAGVGLARRTRTEHSTRPNRTNGAQNSRNRTLPFEQAGPQQPNGAAEPVDVNPIIPSHICEDNNVNSEGPETEANIPPNTRLHLTLPGDPQRGDVEHVLKACGFEQNECDHWLSAVPIDSLLDGIHCLADGGWRDSTSDKNTLRSFFRGKLKLNRDWMRRRDDVASGQTAAMMSMDGGTGPPGHAEQQQPRRAKTDAEKQAEEESARKARSEAAAHARESTRPGGLKAPLEWRPGSTEQPGERAG